MENKIMSKEEIFERMKTSLTQGQRFCEVVQAYLKGEFINEQVAAEAFDEIFTENKESEAKNASSYLAQIIRHIFKIKYGKYSETFDKLKEEIDNLRDEIIILTKWDAKRPDRKVVELIEEDLYLVWNRAKSKFQKDVNKNPKDYMSIKKLPKECPWSLKELIEDDCDSLITSLKYSDD